MKKAIVVALTGGLVAGALVGPADAGKKKKKPVPVPVKIERVVEIEYQTTGIGVATPARTLGICPFSDAAAQACVEAPMELGEKFVKVEVKDTTGQKQYGFISQGDVDGDGIADGYGTFCGVHAEPVELASQSAPVRVSFYPGATADCAPSVASTGTVVFTFSNLP
ncbi:MAG TPA: hypothetical protein VG318_09550 [Actinomycetota bacterium]|nr:hypothetical protein [Actinomycetota bacterium]